MYFTHTYSTSLFLLTVSDEAKSAHQDKQKLPNNIEHNLANENEQVHEQTEIAQESHAEEVPAQGEYVCMFVCLCD